MNVVDCDLTKKLKKDKTFFFKKINFIFKKKEVFKNPHLFISVKV